LRTVAGSGAKPSSATWLIQDNQLTSPLKLRKRSPSSYMEFRRRATYEWDGEYFPKDFAIAREKGGGGGGGFHPKRFNGRRCEKEVKCAIASLPLKYREVFVLRDVQQLKIEEAARFFGITEGSVKNQVVAGSPAGCGSASACIDGAGVWASRNIKRCGLVGIGE